jgi:WD40 repeat protein
MEEAERSTVEPPHGSSTFDGFISYSHAADDLLAPRLQAGLQKFAKPWWKRRAVRIFRDESSLAANPHLWSSITQALDDSSWFVLLLSEDAATSEWVGKEIEHWIANRPADRILPVVTDGTFGWENDNVIGSTVPPALHGVFGEEPRWVDLRFARGETDLDLQNPDFSASVADIAATIRGVAKDELASEEVKQHRRTVRTAWAAGLGLAVLAIAAVVAGIFAIGQRNDARDSAALAETNAAAEAEARLQADSSAALAVARELAASAINVLDEDPELSILLTLEAIDATPAGQDQPQEVIDALWQAVQEDRLEAVVETGYGDGTYVALAPDDTTLFVVNGYPVGGFPQDLVVQAYSTSDLEKLWEYELVVANILDPESEGDYLFWGLDVSPDGERLSLGLFGSPNRYLILDASDGSVVQTMLPDCEDIPNPQGWSPDGSSFAVISGCDASVEVLDGETFEPTALIDMPDASQASFDDSGRLFLFSPFGDVAIYEPPDFSEAAFLEGAQGLGDVSPDGSTVVTFNTPTDPCLLFSPIPRPADCGTLTAFDTATGEPIDALTPLPAIPSENTMTDGFSGSNRLYAVPTQGAETPVWDIETGQQVFSLPSGVAVNAAITSDGRRLFTGHQNGQFKVWDLSPNVGLDPIGEVGNYTLISANSNSAGQTIGAFVATDPGTFESKVFFFDLNTGALIGQPVVGQLPITPLANDRFLITESYTGGAAAPSAWFVYDPMSGDRARIAGCDVDPATGLCDDGVFPIPYFWGVSDDGSQLVRFFGDGTFTLVDPNDGSQIGELTPAAPFEFVGGFSDEMISGSSQGQVLAEDRVTGEELARIPDGGARFEGDFGTSVFYRVESIAALDMTTWDIWFFPIDLGRVQGIAVESELRRLALGDENGVHVFDLDTGEKLSSIPVSGIADLHWIDQDHVLVGTQTGAWAIVSLLTEDLIASARAGVTRGFTPDECATYRIDPCTSDG